MSKLREFGSSILHLRRTTRFQTGVRGVFYLPDGSSVHTLEDDPIEAGTYFLSPDDTGRFRNWVVEDILESRSVGNSRDNVEIHIGNTLHDTVGCILPGRGTSVIGVSDSRGALDRMRRVLEREAENPKTWILVISEAS